MKAGIRQKVSGPSAAGAASRFVPTCEVEGCAALAFFGRYCDRCQEEIGALRRMAALRAEDAERRRAQKEAREIRRAWRRGRYAEICAAVTRRLWIANLALVVIAASVLAYLYGAALLDWLQIGGGR